MEEPRSVSPDSAETPGTSTSPRAVEFAEHHGPRASAAWRSPEAHRPTAPKRPEPQLHRARWSSPNTTVRAPPRSGGAPKHRPTAARIARQRRNARNLNFTARGGVRRTPRPARLRGVEEPRSASPDSAETPGTSTSPRAVEFAEHHGPRASAEWRSPEAHRPTAPKRPETSTSPRAVRRSSPNTTVRAPPRSGGAPKRIARQRRNARNLNFTARGGVRRTPRSERHRAAEEPRSASPDSAEAPGSRPGTSTSPRAVEFTEHPGQSASAAWRPPKAPRRQRRNARTSTSPRAVEFAEHPGPSASAPRRSPEAPRPTALKRPDRGPEPQLHRARWSSPNTPVRAPPRRGGAPKRLARQLRSTRIEARNPNFTARGGVRRLRRSSASAAWMSPGDPRPTALKHPDRSRALARTPSHEGIEPFGAWKRVRRHARSPARLLP